MEKQNKNFNTIISISTLIILLLAIILPSLLFYFGKDMQSVVFVPNSKLIFDKSFNERAYDAGVQFSEDYHEESFNYIKPISYDQSGYEQVIRTLYSNGTETIIMIGNEVQGTSITNVIKEYPDKKALYIDDSNYSIATDENPGIVGIKFNANEVAFIEGIIASIFVVANYPDDESEWNVGSWGGMQIPNVIQLMSGFEQGVNWFNYFFFGTTVEGEAYDNSNSDTPNAPASLMLDPGKKVNLIDYRGHHFDYVKRAVPANSNWFSNNFNIGEGRQLALGLVKNHANVIFPIAGTQTADGLAVVQSASTKEAPIRILGVDVDARDIYPDYEDYILSSAYKDVKKATSYGLYYTMEKFKDDIAEVNGESIHTNEAWKFIEPADKGGWNNNPKDPSPEEINTGINPYGNQFIGTFENGGVGVTQVPEASVSNDQRNDYEILDSWLKLEESYSGLEIDYSADAGGLNKFIDYSMIAQEATIPAENKDLIIKQSAIENSSHSFASDYNFGNGALPTNTSDVNAPWIPDWSIY